MGHGIPTELQLGGVEHQDGTVSSSTFSAMNREPDRVVEGETERRVGLQKRIEALDQR